MQLPSVDVFIGLMFLVGIGYGFILRREKTITTLCSVYVGLVIAGNFSESVFNFFNGNTTIANQVWIRSNASVSTISIVIFLACILLISGAIHTSSSKSGDLSLLEVLVYSSLTIALILSSVMNFLPEATRQNYIDTSKVAGILYNFRTLIVVAGPLMLVLLNFRRK